MRFWHKKTARRRFDKRIDFFLGLFLAGMVFINVRLDRIGQGCAFPVPRV